MISQWFMPSPWASVISRGLHGPLLPYWLGKANLLADIVSNEWRADILITHFQVRKSIVVFAYLKPTILQVCEVFGK